MNEEEKVKKQLIKNMVLNLITFSIIFYILGAVIYSQFNNSLYISADSELQKTMIKKDEQFMAPDDKRPIERNEPRGEIRDAINSPRLVFIARDENGQMLEEQENENLNEIFKNIEFNKNLIDTIYEIELQGYSYRAINYKLEDGGYNQVLINVDSEKIIAQKFITNLTISFIISIIAILIASYILSKKTLKPIVESWKKQTRICSRCFT